MKILLRNIILLVSVLVISSNEGFAQPGGPRPGGGRPTPISGLEILVGSGIALGLRKLFNGNKKSIE